MQIAVRQILAELNRMNAQVRLQLPAGQRSVQRQILHLALIQQQLEAMREKVFVMFGLGTNLPTDRAYLCLTKLIEDIHQDASSLRFLAEEYPTDPEGTVACLQEAYGNVPTLRSRLDRLSAQSEQRSSNSVKNGHCCIKLIPVPQVSFESSVMQAEAYSNSITS